MSNAVSHKHRRDWHLEDPNCVDLGQSTRVNIVDWCFIINEFNSNLEFTSITICITLLDFKEAWTVVSMDS